MRAAPTFPRPLFDRFFLDGRGEYPSARVDLAGYLSAVACDVEMLLGTRSVMPLDPDDEDPDGLSVPGYGLPDFHSLSPSSLDDVWLLAARVRQTLERFEPRLSDIEAVPERGDAFDAGRIVVRGRVRGCDEILEMHVSAASLINGD